ncbi:hypothetical protein MMC10_000637 [Thelotrema lepadinum]|nr:hypothetical protein [Thelotrema lepadinum]
MGVTYSQFFPPYAVLTEKNLPSQEGKVFIVTGGYSGIGYALCAILYYAGGKVYLAGRSETKAKDAISKIKATKSKSNGDIVFLSLSLDDLKTIKPAVETFTSLETRLDVLFNNAGVSNPPKNSVSAQGHELQMVTNCLGHYLLAQLLLPTLRATAQRGSPGAVRIVWSSSLIVDLSAPTGGLNLSDLETPPSSQQRSYENSKVGNWFLANAVASQVGSDGILSVTQNPGNLKTELLRHMPWVVGFLTAPLLYTARDGAYTELWAGLSEELTIEDGGKYIVPWGRLHPSPRADMLAAMKTKDDGGTGVAALFLEWCDKQIADFR